MHVNYHPENLDERVQWKVKNYMWGNIKMDL